MYLFYVQLYLPDESKFYLRIAWQCNELLDKCAYITIMIWPTFHLVGIGFSSLPECNNAFCYDLRQTLFSRHSQSVSIFWCICHRDSFIKQRPFLNFLAFDLRLCSFEWSCFDGQLFFGNLRYSLRAVLRPVWKYDFLHTWTLAYGWTLW